MIISVDNFFNILNLVARIIIVIYLLKRFVIGQVTTSIALEKQDIQFLKQQYQQIYQACQKIEDQIAQDQKAFAVLQEKFKIWNQQEDLIAMQKKAACAVQQKNIEISNLKKIKYLQHRAFIEVEVPNLLQNVHEKLQQEFEQDKNLGKKYQTKVLQALEKLQ